MQTNSQEHQSFSWKKVKKIFHGRFLYLEEVDGWDENPIIIPFGSISKPSGYHFDVTVCQGEREGEWEITKLEAKRLRLRKVVIHVFEEPEENGIKKGFDPELVEKIKVEKVDKKENQVYVVPPEKGQNSKPYPLDSKKEHSHFYIDKHNLVKTSEGKKSGNIVVYGVIKETVSSRNLLETKGQIVDMLLGEEIQEVENSLFPEGKIELEEIEVVEEIGIIPAYSRKREMLKLYNEKLKLKILDQEVELEFFVIDNDAQRIEASEVILRSHYLDVPKNGLFLGCKFADSTIQKRLSRSQIGKERGSVKANTMKSSHDKLPIPIIEHSFFDR